MAFETFLEKEKMLVANIFSFSKNVFFSVKSKFNYLSQIRSSASFLDSDIFQNFAMWLKVNTFVINNGSNNLLLGNDRLTIDENKQIFAEVHRFILATKRFSTSGKASPWIASTVTVMVNHKSECNFTKN